jgi:hypothetical protein
VEKYRQLITMRYVLTKHILRHVAQTLPKAAALVVVWALLGAPPLHPQQSRPAEYEVKATYLYNFGRFVEWPANVTVAKGDPFAICVLGHDPFGPILDATLAGETIAGKSAVATRISKPQEATNCRILFISSSEDNHLKGILTALDKWNVLTVSDIPRFAQRGGMIQFVLDGNNVRFEVNLTTARDAGLTLSSELLKVAITVRRDLQPGD